MIKKLYSFNNNREIWRIIPAVEENLLIEERNKKTKEVYFNCLNINSGKKILNGFQLSEKFWVGVEAVHNDIIFFHKFLKPDLPTHKSIIAFDIKKKSVLWENTDLSFYSISDNSVIAYKSLFEGREYYKLNLNTGELLKELKDIQIETISTGSNKNELEEFTFSSIYTDEIELKEAVKKYIKKAKEEKVVVGKVEFIVQKSILFISFHSPTKSGKLNKIFNAVDIVTGKIILNKIINYNIEVFIPDSFFLIKNLLFVIFEEKKLECYKIQ